MSNKSYIAFWTAILSILAVLGINFTMNASFRLVHIAIIGLGILFALFLGKLFKAF